jgi:hypothetical protein
MKGFEGKPMQFKKLVDEKLAVKLLADGVDLTDKSFVLSIVNDFEDGEWRHAAFQSFIWDNIALTALSKRERDALIENPHTKVVSAAKNLRLTDKTTDIGAGSELAEAVLYGIMAEHYKALPVVPKIFYKQNTQDNAKGADSVHITVAENGEFDLWFGEAKFYNSIEDARLASIISSVGESLKSEKLKKENAIICNVNDLDELAIDPAARSKIKTALGNQASIDDIKPKLHVPILLLHECDATRATKAWSETYEKEMIAHHRERSKRYLEKQLVSLREKVYLYDSITFHVIALPVPEKEVVIKKFLAAVEFYKEQ